MGTHPNAPTTIPHLQGKTLEEWVKENPEALGKTVQERFNGALPFLFKVLSVNKALSIQAHPNKSHAEELHQKDPENYKDPNHKPEMAIALTDFTGLCGFRPVSEIADFVQNIPELRSVIGEKNCETMLSSVNGDVSEEEAIRSCFSALMRQDRAVVESHLRALAARVKKLANSGEDTSRFVGDVLLKLDEEFPGDVGGFAVYFLNVMRLKEGEAIYLGANLPHAYLSGDCMECMACSDNVVRAGLTPKFIDTETLLHMLNYSGKPAAENKFQPAVSEENGCTLRRFTPPIPDFAVTEIQCVQSERPVVLQAMDSASILICITGSGFVDSGIAVHRGTILFIAANETVSLKVESSSRMLLYRAHAGC
ncbi:mannose-6-phosphate isomerase-like isoform X2 [Dreissena polymorpha]|nr:mannose-6-phosphate isomerase-like isoform X2 [Dreissena polymorpha]